MNKLFKLIYVNLLSLFDINKIIIAREDGVKSNLEKRTVIVFLINVVYAYFLYLILKVLNFNNNELLLVIGFLISTLYCFASDIFVVEPMIFKSEDTDILFSYPVTRNQILISKLFTVYLKNILSTILFMFVSLYVYYIKVSNITDTIIIMYLLVMLTVPLIPIMLSTIIAYIKDYFKTKTHNSILYRVISLIIILGIFLLFMMLFSNISFKSIELLLEEVVNRFFYVYPLAYILYIMLVKESILLFVVMILIPIVCCYLYTLVISNNYLKICTLLKGVKTDNSFELKKTINMKIIGGLLRKEFKLLFKNKTYLNHSFSMSIMFTILLFIICRLVDKEYLYSIENMKIYMNLYVPTILAMFGSIGCSTISSISLEKSNLQMLRTLPVGMGKILVSKWLVNIIIGIVFVVINGSLVWYFYDLSKLSVLFSYLIPFLALLLVSLTGLVLDYQFIEKNEKEDNSIIKQRLITMVPTFISIFIGIMPFFFNVYKQYTLLLGAYCIIFVVFMIIEGIYLLINRDKMLSNLIN